MMMQKGSTVVTVTGAVPADQLGVTLAHEHVWCDISIHSGKKDNVVQDVELLSEELEFFRNFGGHTVIEVTPEDIGRNAARLRDISLASGVLIVSGIAFYDENLYPDWIRQASADQIADYFVHHIEVGTQGIRAGLIGELASHNEPQPNFAGYQLRPLEKLVFQAAAKAQKRTGVAISTHASLGRAGHAQLDVLEAAGADVRKVVIGHCDAHWHEDPGKDMEYYLPILKRGAYCQFDMVGWEELAPDAVRAERLAALISLGCEKQLLLSTDTCRLSQLHKNGGRGFDYLWRSFLPRLRALGVTDSQIHSMMVEAPRNMLARSLETWMQPRTPSGSATAVTPTATPPKEEIV
jgi:phosphotriesterase-related protein